MPVTRSPTPPLALLFAACRIRNLPRAQLQQRASGTLLPSLTSITAVPSLSLLPQPSYGSTLHLPLRDTAEESIVARFESAFQFIEDCRMRGGRCLLHCQRGISRRFHPSHPSTPLKFSFITDCSFRCRIILWFSPSIAAAYLLWFGRASGATLAQALAHVCERRCFARSCRAITRPRHCVWRVTRLLQGLRPAEPGVFSSTAAIRNAGVPSPAYINPAFFHLPSSSIVIAAPWFLLSSHRRAREVARCAVECVQ